MNLCGSCQAACCRMQVILVTDTGMPDRFIATDSWGGQTMLQLEDGWCAALDRNTFLCSQYENRPLVCREFEMGGSDCLATRVDIKDTWIDPT